MDKKEYIEREAAIELLSQPITMSMCLSAKECHHKIAQQRIDRYLIENIPAADVRPVVQRDAVMQALSKYFSIGDSYTYELTRVKEAFHVGTMLFDDFEEWNEDNVSDLCDYLMKELFVPFNCGAWMEES